MRGLAAAVLFAGLLVAGCSGAEMGGGGARMTEQQLCEQTRGAGVWVPSAGACIRGGGN
jgi:hypothetical protein